MFAKIMAQFEDCRGKALSFQEISNGVFDSKDPFDIEQVRQWMPLEGNFLYGNIRQLWYRISVVGTALTLLVASGKLETISVKNPRPHSLEWSPTYLMYYYVPSEDVMKN